MATYGTSFLQDQGDKYAGDEFPDQWCFSMYGADVITNGASGELPHHSKALFW